MTHSLQAAFTILFLAGAVLRAQDSAPPTIRVTTRLVQVNVVIHGKAGKPVPGLKKEDFTLFERGREKAIALFSDDSEVSRPVIADRLPPDVYSNRIISEKGPLSVFLFDASTTRFGGRTLIDRNDVDTAIKVAIDDSRDTYTLGFYSPDEDWDGKFYEIKVKLNRPGTELRYRKVFFALADPALDVQDLKVEVSNTLASVIEDTAIDIRVHVDPVKPSTLSLTLQIAADNVYFTERNGSWTGSLEFVFAQFGPDGSRLSLARQPLALNISPPTHDEFLQRGIILTKTIQLVANAERLTVVAVDASTGCIGSLHIPLKAK